MGLKHSKRTRAEKLKNRNQPIRGFDKFLAPVTVPASRSKYMPHFGAKQRAKLMSAASIESWF